MNDKIRSLLEMKNAEAVIAAYENDVKVIERYRKKGLTYLSDAQKAAQARVDELQEALQAVSGGD